MPSVILPKQSKTTSVSSIGRGGQVITCKRPLVSNLKPGPVQPNSSSTSIKVKFDPIVFMSLALVSITVAVCFSLMQFTVGAIDQAFTSKDSDINYQSVELDLPKFEFVSDSLSLDSRISMVNISKNSDSKKNVLVATTQSSSQASPKELVEQVFAIISSTNRRQTKAHQLAREIVAESIRQKYDPLFVAAVIKSESAFNELAVSNVGAQGLMQIMPATGKYLIKKHQEHFPKAVKLTDRDVNIKLGIKYLRELEQMYQGNRLLTLIAYNWGPGKLDRAIRSGRGVPKECIKYALKILRDHNIWQA
jgi:hypothetical protein